MLSVSNEDETRIEMNIYTQEFRVVRTDNEAQG